MCVDLHQYRPVDANKGGLTGKAGINLEMGPTGDLWVTWWTADVHSKNPTTT